MNIVKTVFSLTLIVGTTAYAAEQIASIPKQVVHAEKAIPDTADGRGLSLLFDETTKPGVVIVSSVGATAKQAGLVDGDVLKEICGQPATSARAYGAVAKAIGENDVKFRLGDHAGTGNVPLAAVKAENRKLVLNKTIQLKADNKVITIPAGEEVRQVCMPIHSQSDISAIVAPFEPRYTSAGQLVAAGKTSMQYRVDRYRAGVPVTATLTAW